MSCDTDITIYTDTSLKWEIDMDREQGGPRSPSLYIRTEGTEIRQFCTIDQLHELQRVLTEALTVEVRHTL